MRITAAREAVRTFLASMTNPADQVGLVDFNTFYHVLSRPTAERERIAGLLDGIDRPTPDQAYTELYASLASASREFAGIGGRKAIIVLSDGENYPYAEHSGKSHPVTGSRITAYTDAILACQQEGVTVYGISFGPEKDRNLQAITVETGGKLFDAADARELSSAYETIRRQVAGEYLLTYRAGLAPAERTHVRVEVDAAGARAAATRFYFASTVLGLPMTRLTPLLLVPLAVAVLLLVVLTLLKLERRPGPASLEVLQTMVGRPSTRVLPLAGTKTVIGATRAADLTISGAPQVQDKHATILYDPTREGLHRGRHRRHPGEQPARAHEEARVRRRDRRRRRHHRLRPAEGGEGRDRETHAEEGLTPPRARHQERTPGSVAVACPAPYSTKIRSRSPNRARAVGSPREFSPRGSRRSGRADFLPPFLGPRPRCDSVDAVNDSYRRQWLSL